MSHSLKDSINKIAKEVSAEKNKSKDSSQKRNQDIQTKLKNRYSWLLVGTVCTLLALMTFVIVYNVIEGKNFTIDVATVLSTLLAFFSIFLSSFFYFKATEQSNAFYDRSYRHTKDIAESLSNMKGEFGKSLENINALSMQLNDRMERISNAASNVQTEQNDSMNLYKELMERAELSEEEKRKYEKALIDKEITINNLINEINTINTIGKRVADGKIRNISFRIVDDFFHNFIEQYIPELRNNPDFPILLEFKNYLIEKGDNTVLTALENLGFLDKHILLTNAGLKRLEMIILNKKNSL